MKKKLIFVSLLLIPALSFCLTKEEIIKKINAYAVQIIDKDLPSLKNNVRILNYDALIFPIIKFVKEADETGKEKQEPVISLSREVLEQVSNRISGAGTPLDMDIAKANDLLDKLQYADINAENSDKQEVLDYLRNKIVEIANHVFSLSVPTTNAARYMILKDDIKSLKNDIDEFEKYFIKYKKSILLEEFSDEAVSNWSYINEKLKDIIIESNSDQLPKYAKDVRNLGNELFEILDKLGKESSAEAKELLKRSLRIISAKLSSDINSLKNLKIISLSKTEARDILAYLNSKLISIINIINSADIASKSEVPAVTFEEINNNLNAYLIQLKQAPLRIFSIRDKKNALRNIENLKKISSTTFTELMFYLVEHKDLEKITKNLNDLNHRLLENLENHYSYAMKTKELVIKDKFKQNNDDRLKIIKKLGEFIKELEILKATNNNPQKIKIIGLVLTTSKELLNLTNEFNKNIQ